MTRLLISGLAALAAVACGQSEATIPLRDEPAEPTIVVQAESLATAVPITGSVTARRRAEMSTRLMARVTDVPADVGHRVRASTVLIRLGVADITANREKATAAVRAAEATRDEAARHAARMDTLYLQDAVSRVQRDQARLGLTQAESQLTMARAALAEVQTANEYARIQAPFDGVVVARHVDPGDMASPGMPLLVVESIGPREAVLAVPPTLALGLGDGDTLLVEGLDGRRTAAPIRAVAGGADPMTRTVEVKVLLPPDWPTGTSATALIPTTPRVTIAIPWSAVVRRGQLTGVRVVTQNAVVLRWIRLGRTIDGTRVEVLSGLEPGDRIVA